MYPDHAYDFVQWERGQTGLYESNYLKANSPDGRRGLWIKHNILAPVDRRHPAVLELWCVSFDRDGDRPRVYKQLVPMEQVAVAKTGLRIEGEGILLTDRETRTRLRQIDGREAAWDLRLTNTEPPLFHLPHDRLYTAPFPKKKLITPAPRLMLEGHLTLDGERLEIDGWSGIRGHNWGTEHAHAYAYGNCNRFEEDEGALIDMFTAKIRVGPLKSPWLSMGILRCDGQQHDFNRIRHALTRDAVVSLPRWQVRLHSQAGELETDWLLDPEQTAGLNYLHPNGRLSYCYNTKFARVRVRYGDRELTSDQAELEFLYSEPVPGIPLSGSTELPIR